MGSWDDMVQIPIICIANDRSAQKMKPLTNVTFDLKFRKCVFPPALALSRVGSW